MLNLRKYIWQALLLAAIVVSTVLACAPSASADQLPDDPAVTDPYFREEAPERQIECPGGVLVPLGEGGTFDCPAIQEEPQFVQEQLPEERIGRDVVVSPNPDADDHPTLSIPAGTTPGADQVEPGDSHPFFNWNAFMLFVLHFLFG